MAHDIKDNFSNYCDSLHGDIDLSIPAVAVAKAIGVGFYRQLQFANPQDYTPASYTNLGKVTGYGTTRIQHAVIELLEAGHLERQIIGTGLANKYRPKIRTPIPERAVGVGG